MQFSRRNFLTPAATGVVGAAAAGAALAPSPARAESAPATPGARARRSTPGARPGANTRFTDQFGNTHRFWDDLVVGRKAVVFNVMYTICGTLCPVVTDNLVAAQRMMGSRVGDDIFMYSITLQPELDTPEVLRYYARNFEVGPGWLFLTSTPEDVEIWRRSFGFSDSDPAIDANIDSHTGMLFYGSERLNIFATTRADGRPQWIAKTVSWMADLAAKA